MWKCGEYGNAVGAGLAPAFDNVKMAAAAIRK